MEVFGTVPQDGLKPGCSIVARVGILLLRRMVPMRTEQIFPYLC